VLRTKGAIPTTVRSIKELTVPMTPSFPTDDCKRKRVFPEDHRDEEKKVVVSTVRAGPTIPTPFHFAAAHRSSYHIENEKSKDNVRTSAEISDHFNKNTRSSNPPTNVVHVMTQPKSPTFRTTQRSNSVGRPKPLSRDELEEKEMIAAQAMAFKAKPVNKKIFESMGVSGVPKVQVKGPTAFAEFHLICQDRADYHNAHKSLDSVSADDSDSVSFKALQMPDFSKPDAPSRKNYQPPKLTEAHSPQLSGGKRSSSAPARRQRPSHEESEKVRRDASNAWKLKNKQKSELTNPTDFNFKTTDRGNASKQAFQDKINRQILEEKAASEVHATPFNEKIFKKSFAVSTSQKELTEFSEFKLLSEERHKEAAIKSMEAAQMELVKNKVEFHARPVPSSTYELKFQTKPSDKEPVTPMNTSFSTDQRSLQRRAFDASVTKSKEEEKNLQEKQKAAQEDKENGLLKNLRRTPASKGGMAFKATKVLTKDTYPSKHVMSTPLTEPKSPNLRTALRTRVNE
jgi:hypothetical protein